MPTTAKYRRTWFSLLRAAGIPEEDRHWIQQVHTGKRSTRDWGPADWCQAIAGLQRDIGQHRDRHPHVREDQPIEQRSATASAGWASPAQCRLIETVCDEVDWHAGRKRGPFLFLLASIFRSSSLELRRSILQQAHDDGLRGMGLWARLTSQEAAWFIRALRRIKTTIQSKP